MNTTVNSKAAKLYCFFIESPLLESEKRKRKKKTSKETKKLNSGNSPPLLRWGRSIRINRLQPKLFRQHLFLAVLMHERPQIEHQVPRLFGLDVVGKRRHGSAVQASHEDPIDILIGIAAFWPGAIGKVEGRDGTSEIIGERRGGGSVGHTLNAVALPALHPGKHIPPGLDAVGSHFRLRRNHDRRPWFFVRPARREMLHPGDQVGAFLFA